MCVHACMHLCVCGCVWVCVCVCGCVLVCVCVCVGEGSRYKHIELLFYYNNNSYINLPTKYHKQDCINN